MRALRQPVVQRDSDDGSVDAATVRGHAQKGIRGAGGRLPFLAQIQRAFGRHDITRVRAHTGEHASVAARGMRARAYAVGEHVAFDGAPDLHTAAHEAAHVVQQRSGVSTPDGVGRPGDRHERHADHVADLVAGGRSAEAVLGSPSPASSSMSAVQLATSEQELIDADKALRAPDALNQDTVFTIKQVLGAGTKGNKWSDAEGTRDLTKGTKVRIITRTDDTTTIRIFEWNNDVGGWDQLEGTVATAAITLGSSEQQDLPEDAVIVPESDDEINQEAVYQAGLSDCYFQAALASLAHSRPKDIRDMIEDTGDAVKVRLYDGPSYAPKAHIITLNRKLFLDAKGNPIYHGKKGSPLWPAFINKAWAVFNDSYADAQMGLSGDAMFALTGKPSVSQALEKLETGKLGVKAPTEAFKTYDRIRNNLDADKPVALGTGSFAKGWFKAMFNATKDHGTWAQRSLPSGDVRNLHCYAVLDIQPRNLKLSDFEWWVPSIDVTLRDPRDADGATFTRKLRDILVAGKFSTFSFED